MTRAGLQERPVQRAPGPRSPLRAQGSRTCHSPDPAASGYWTARVSSAPGWQEARVSSLRLIGQSERSC